MFLLVMSNSQTVFGQSSKNSTQIPVDRATLELANKAADEVKASRALIAAQDAQIVALKANADLLNQKIALMESIDALKSQQIVEKDKVIAAQEEQKKILTNQVAKLERSNKRLKKIGVVLGAAAGVFGYIVLH
jgi:hypothetical protein